MSIGLACIGHGQVEAWAVLLKDFVGCAALDFRQLAGFGVYSNNLIAELAGVTPFYVIVQMVDDIFNHHNWPIILKRKLDALTEINSCDLCDELGHVITSYQGLLGKLERTHRNRVLWDRSEFRQPEAFVSINGARVPAVYDRLRREAGEPRSALAYINGGLPSADVYYLFISLGIELDWAYMSAVPNSLCKAFRELGAVLVAVQEIAEKGISGISRFESWLAHKFVELLYWFQDILETVGRYSSQFERRTHGPLSLVKVDA